jgi:hypothetical protein
MKTAQNKTSYAAQAVGEKKYIFFIQAEQPQGPAWYYIQVVPAKLHMFKKKLGGEAFNVNEYGRILHSGWGEAPSPALKQAIEDALN